MTRLVPLEKVAVMSPFWAIATEARLPNGVPLALIDWTAEVPENWVRPLVAIAGFRLTATGWGVVPVDKGKQVWADLAVPVDATAALNCTLRR